MSYSAALPVNLAENVATLENYKGISYIRTKKNDFVKRSCKISAAV